MSQKLTVQINGVKYSITTTEPTEYVHGLVGEIDSVVRGLTLGTSVSANQALLLAALHYLDLYKKADENADHLRRQISDYGKETSKLRQELAEVKKELGKSRQGAKHAKA